MPLGISLALTHHLKSIKTEVAMLSLETVKKYCLVRHFRAFLIILQAFPDLVLSK
jgi:hypothetical protein